MLLAATQGREDRQCTQLKDFRRPQNRVTMDLVLRPLRLTFFFSGGGGGGGVCGCIHASSHASVD